MRHGVKHQKYSIDLFYVTPSAGNATAAAKYAENRFSVTRQLHFSLDESKLSLDLAIFINGLPVATFELKNSLTKQNVDHAIRQYCNDRDPRERLFGFGRCMVHFAIDDSQVMMCTHLKGKKSWFLPFNKGHNDGAGNPPNPNGLKTDCQSKIAARSNEPAFSLPTKTHTRPPARSCVASGPAWPNSPPNACYRNVARPQKTFATSRIVGLQSLACAGSCVTPVAGGPRTEPTNTPEKET